MSQLLDRQFLVNNVIDRIERLEHRLQAIEAGTIVEIIPDDNPGTELPLNLNEGPDIDLVGSRIGRGGDTVLLFKANGDPVAEFTTLADAVGEAISGDTIVLPSRTTAITAGVTLGAGMALVGMSEKSIISASGFSGTAITMAAGAICCGFALTYVSNGTTAVGIDAQFSGAIVLDVVVNVSGGSSSNVGIVLGTSGTGLLAGYGTSPGVTHTEAARWSVGSGGNFWQGAGFRLTAGNTYGAGHLIVTIAIESGSIPGGYNIKLMASDDYADSGVTPDTPPTWTGSTVGLSGPIGTGTITLDGSSSSWPGTDAYFTVTSGWGGVITFTARVTKVEWHQTSPDVTYTLWDENLVLTADAPIATGCRITAAGTAASALKVDALKSGSAMYNKLSGATYDLNVLGAMHVYANQYTHSLVNGTPTFLAGDRAAYSVEDWHASDIEADAPTRHAPLPGADGGGILSSGGIWTRVTTWALSMLADWVRGKIIRGGAAAWEAYDAKSAGFIVQGDGTDVKSAAFDWDTIGAGSGADMAHDHSAAGEGGQLAQANTHQSADTDAATTSLHHTIGATATTAAAGNHTHGLAGRYWQFVYEVSGGDFTLVKDSTGEPVMVLEDLV